MKRTFAGVIAQRIGGDKPSTPERSFAAAIAGTVGAGLTYKVCAVSRGQ